MGRTNGYDDNFFGQTHCDRCGKSLKGHARTMSWFTEDTICTSGLINCQLQEVKIKKAISERGEDTRDYEGCGFIPTVLPAKDFIVKN